MMEMRNAFKILIVKPEENRPLGRHRFRREDNIKIATKGKEHDDVYWLRLAQYSVQWWAPVKTVTKFRVYKRRRISRPAK